MDSFKVTIYIETSIHGPAVKSTGAGMYLIEYIRENGEPETRQGIVIDSYTTEIALALEALREALKKLKKSCSIRVSTQCSHILNVTQNYWLAQWKENGWKNVRGNPVKNAPLWKEVSQLMENHTVCFGNDHNSYAEVMRKDMEREEKQ